MAQVFVGFSTMEKFLQARDPSKPVNADCIYDPGKPSHGICLVTLEVMLSQKREDEVLYCAVCLDRYQAISGDNLPLGNEAAVQKRADSGWKVIREFLEENEVQYREALIAMPHNIKRMAGHADCLLYNHGTGLYERIVTG